MTDGFAIGIAGGTGGMGRWFEDYFSKAGHRVMIAGRNTELRYRELPARCDVVVLSTPEEPALQIAKDVGPRMSPGQLLMDFCSRKSAIVEGMAAATEADVIGTHPLFPPSTSSLKGQNVILCEARDNYGWGKWLKELFAAGGAVVTRLDPAEHDKKMAVAQSLVHFLTLVFARTLQKLDIAPQEGLSFATPIFRLNMDLIGRMFAQDRTLYADLIGGNPYTEEVLATFFAAEADCRQAFLGDNKESSMDLLDEVFSHFGQAFCEQALSETTRALQIMYEDPPEDSG